GLQNDPSLVLEAVKANGLALEHGSEEVQGNPKVVAAAIESNPLALEFASASMRANHKSPRRGAQGRIRAPVCSGLLEVQARHRSGGFHRRWPARLSAGPPGPPGYGRIPTDSESPGAQAQDKDEPKARQTRLHPARREIPRRVPWRRSVVRGPFRNCQERREH
ncbi:unnamed protein product, partial [Polarella glacialis]